MKKMHWAQIKERKGILGMRFMLKMYQIFGRHVFMFLLRPVIFYFWLTGKQQRQASEQWLKQVRLYAEQHHIDLPDGLTSYQHFMRFGQSLLNKIACWLGHIVWGRDIQFARECDEQIANSYQKKGCLLLVSHLGDIEVCRALAQIEGYGKINALVFSENAKNFEKVKEAVGHDIGVNLISVKEIGPELTILLKEKIDAGEWVAIVGDRLPVSLLQNTRNQPYAWSRFLDKKAPFAIGPFMLILLLQCPVLMMVVLKDKKRFQVYCERICEAQKVPRTERMAYLQKYMDMYAEKLTIFAMKSPLEWFNFYDFWSVPSVECDKEKIKE